MYIKRFEEISKEDIKEVGGKGASLGEMTRAGIPVPTGFVVTTETYKKFINTPLPVDVEQQILQAFDDLQTERVAVRSSAVAEDSKTASWAGQLESYLNVSRDDLIEKIRLCWNSIKSERALSYASQQNLNEEDLVVAVVVQKMVESEASGVLFTVNPVTGNRDELMIEACFGLGEMLVQGLVTPDNFVVDKKTLKIKEKNIDSQETMLVFSEGENREVKVPDNQKNEPAIKDNDLVELSKLGKIIENHYSCPQDIEWALEKGKLYIVQSRPITTLR